MESRLIDRLAIRHDDWIHMALSFGCTKEEANELVQEMYIRVTKYVDDPNRIMYNEKELNNYYIYVTLRNLYLSNIHKPMKSNHFSIYSVRPSDRITMDIDDECNQRYESSFDKLISKIESLVDSWYWYDKKLWNIHFKNEMSMRRISKETRISLSSIFNTLSNGKNKVREQTKKEYEEYKESKKDI